MAGNISAHGFITFAEKDIPKGMRNSIKALHITVKCQNVSMGNVLIDNGSALNILPLKMLKRLPVDEACIQTNHLIVKAFDGTRRSVIGEVEITIEIGGVSFALVFQVLDIQHPSYSSLLGRPWIHQAGVVPSTLHQVVKFLTPEKFVEVKGEEDFVVASASGFSYVEPPEGSYECSFRAFEVAETIPMSMGDYSVMSIRFMMKRGFKEGKGLGMDLQGISQAVEVPTHEGPFGLGFKPTAKDWAEAEERMKLRRMARMGHGVEEKRMRFPPLYETFKSAGWVNNAASVGESGIEGKLQNLDINAVTDDTLEEQDCPWIRELAPGEVLNN